MSSSRAFGSQLTSGRIGGSASLRPGGNALRPCSISERAVIPKVSRTPERPAGLDLLDHRRGAAEQRVAVALRLLPRDRLAQQVERRAVFGVDIVLEELVGALADMRVHVDDGIAVIGHSVLPPARTSESAPHPLLPLAGERAAMASRPRPSPAAERASSRRAAFSLERLRPSGGDVVVALGGEVGLGEILFAETVEAGAAGQDLAGDVLA